MSIFQNDERNQQIASSSFGDFLIHSGTVYQQIGGNFSLIAVLLKGNTKNLLAFGQLRLVIRVNLDDVIGALALGFQHSQGFLGVAGSDNAVRNLTVQHLGSLHIADIGQSNKITIGAHAVSTTSTCISICQRGQLQIVHIINLFQSVAHRQSYSGACRAYMLEGSSCWQTSGLFQLLNQLPAVEGIQKVNIARTAIEHLNGQLSAISHVNSCFGLVGITTIFQC